MVNPNEPINLDDAVNMLWQKYNQKGHSADLSDVDIVVDELRLKLPKSCLESLASRFSYPAGDPLPRLGNLYRKQGYLTRNQAY